MNTASPLSRVLLVVGFVGMLIGAILAMIEAFKRPAVATS
jgi:hypothetical protein